MYLKVVFQQEKEMSRELEKERKRKRRAQNSLQGHLLLSCVICLIHICLLSPQGVGGVVPTFAKANLQDDVNTSVRKVVAAFLCWEQGGLPTSLFKMGDYMKSK